MIPAIKADHIVIGAQSNDHSAQLAGVSSKLFFTDAGLGILVVTTEKIVNIGLIRLEIKNAIGKLSLAS